MKRPVATLPQQAGGVETIIANAVRAEAHATDFWKSVLSFPGLATDLESWLIEQARTRTGLSEHIKQRARECAHEAPVAKRPRLRKPREQCQSIGECAHGLQWLAPAWQAIAVFLPLQQRIGLRTWCRSAKSLKFSSEAWNPMFLDRSMCALFLRRTQNQPHRSVRSYFPPGFFNVRVLSVDLMEPDDFSSESGSSESEDGNAEADRIHSPMINAIEVVLDLFKSLQQPTITNIKLFDMECDLFVEPRIHTRFRRQEVTLASGAGEPTGRFWASNIADPVVVDVGVAVRANAERSPLGSPAASQLTRAEALLLAEFPFLYKHSRGDWFQKRIQDEDEMERDERFVSGSNARKMYKKRMQWIDQGCRAPQESDIDDEGLTAGGSTSDTGMYQP
ncbi:unnamed protein product [Prorocentrum cordatum]|uniref:Uncharacterized protein n=1 Tax=Prorocentrum cordatum TaxID=2364126 RepID=A0ABN9PXZ7_9DINO|nr:unnamed protein product [Polarella glacialis]